MANLADGSGSVNSNIVSGIGTSTATFTLPGSVPLDVESVLATVDNAAGGDTAALLTVRDPSGEVIARKRQGDSIDAGASGTATWALRLADSASPSSGTAVQLAGYDLATGGPFPQPQLTSYFLNAWTLQAGVPLLDITTDPFNATVLTDGLYTWHWHYRYDTQLAPQGAFASYFAWFGLQLSTIPGPLFSDHEAVLPLYVFFNGTFPQASNSFRLPMHAGDSLVNPTVRHNVPAGDPNFASLHGGNCQLILLREPIKPPFPTI